jgi:hypothetical protein
MVERADNPNVARWPCAVMCVVAVVVLWTDLRRLQDPVGEKYMTYLQPGAADFVPFFFGACALVSGVNPYRNDVEAWRDPWSREAIVNGTRSAQVYLPTHLLLYTPLVLVAGGNPLEGGRPRVAGRYWFDLNLLFLALLAVVTWGILARAEGEARAITTRSFSLLVFLLFALALNAGTTLGLERGQSENLTALLCWSAVLLVLRERPGPAMFLAVAAALLKGYGALFAGGLGLLLLDRRRATRAIGGAAAALGLLLLPVAAYLPDALAMARMRVLALDPAWRFVGSWQNHSFRNLALQLAPAWVTAGENGLRLLAAVATVLSWLNARRALRRDTAAPESAFWLSLFAVCALGTMIGFPSVSYSYNTIQVLPGALVVAMGQDQFVRVLGLGRRTEALARILLLVASGLLCLYTFALRSNFPADALGLVLLLGLAATAGADALRRGRRDLGALQ